MRTCNKLHNGDFAPVTREVVVRGRAIVPHVFATHTLFVTTCKTLDIEL